MLVFHFLFRINFSQHILTCCQGHSDSSVVSFLFKYLSNKNHTLICSRNRRTRLTALSIKQIFLLILNFDLLFCIYSFICKYMLIALYYSTVIISVKELRSDPGLCLDLLFCSAYGSSKYDKNFKQNPSSVSNNRNLSILVWNRTINT